MFKKLNVKLLYSIVYYFLINKQNKRINQIIKIVIKLHLIIIKNSTILFDVLFKIQQYFNNKIFAIIIKTSNETIYELTLIDSLNLSKYINIKKLIKKKFVNQHKSTFV